MRVLSIGNMYPPHHLGGYELMWRSATGHLRAAGHEVRVVTTDYRAASPDPGVPEDADVHRELRWYWRDHAFPPIGVRERRRLERHNLAVLDRHLRDFAPEVVNWWAMGGMSMSLLERVRRLRRPAVGVVVDDWMVYGPRVDAWQRAFGRPSVVAAVAERVAGVPTGLDLSGAASWVFVSETVRRHALDAGLPVSDSSVAQGGIDPAAFKRAAERPWGGRLLCLGRIDRRKGIATALRALPLIPDANLAVVGAGDDGHLEELRSLADELGVRERVSFGVRPRDQVAAAYAEADAVLFPVLWEEPWGLVPLEAMAVGTPVVATGTGGSGEYLRDGENSLLFEPRDDPAALAAAVRRLADGEGLRHSLREGGFATAERFTESRFNEAVATVIQYAAG